jgi:hypothetical protein
MVDFTAMRVGQPFRKGWSSSNSSALNKIKVHFLEYSRPSKVWLNRTLAQLGYRGCQMMDRLKRLTLYNFPMLRDFIILYKVKFPMVVGTAPVSFKANYTGTLFWADKNVTYVDFSWPSWHTWRRRARFPQCLSLQFCSKVDYVASGVYLRRGRRCPFNCIVAILCPFWGPNSCIPPPLLGHV